MVLWTKGESRGDSGQLPPRRGAAKMLKGFISRSGSCDRHLELHVITSFFYSEP